MTHRLNSSFRSKCNGKNCKEEVMFSPMLPHSTR